MSLPALAARGSSTSPFLAGLALPPVRLQMFEGPLDLLLHLVRAGRMDIFDLPMLTLCDQYLAHLDTLQDLDLQVAGEFFVMAATLLEIKSRLLLPAPPKEEIGEDDADSIDPRAELVERLLEYGKYQAIAETLRRAEGDRRDVFFRGPTEYSGAFTASPRWGEMSADALLRTLERILQTVGAGERAVTSVRRQKITLRMKMRETLLRAEQTGDEGVSLTDLLPPPPFAVLEIVLVFLALLELMKVGNILVAQEAFCGEVRIFFVPEAQRAAIVGLDVEESFA